jgi:ParB-like chromosome segregation protein Spo0J
LERSIVTVAAIAPVPAPEEMTISLEAVRVRPSMRTAGVDPLHVAMLAEVASEWPPILVCRADASVVDGQHRVAAARQLGLRKIRATFFDGSPDDVYVEFVRRNVTHGLPLTLAERRAAARQMLRSQGHRSDRAIAAACGISPTTIARLRKEFRDDSGASEHDPKGRTGRDGRVRPLNGMALRARIEHEIALRPEASLRSIARVVGASPETVRSVRNAVRLGAHTSARSDCVHDAASENSSAPAPSSVAVDPREDPAFADREGGQEFVEWFEATAVEEPEAWKYLDAVPLSRVYEIADLARRRAEFWTRFAKSLEARVRRWA